MAWLHGLVVAIVWQERCRGGGDDLVAPLLVGLGGDVEVAAAASAAAFAKPCSASIGALRVDRGSVSSDSSSDDGAVLGTIPYVAYLCGCGACET